MLKYLIKRLALSVLILVGVSIIIYFLIRLMPVDFVRSKIDNLNQGGAVLTEDQVKNMYSMYGLEENPTFSGMVNGYLNWLKSLCKFDLGTSFLNGKSVSSEIARYMGTSFTIALIATIFEFMIAIPLGITAATHQYSIRDYVVTILVMIGISLPSFFFGEVLKNIFGVKLGWFEIAGNLSGTGSSAGIAEYFAHFTLPILTVVILSIGGRMRMTRTNMLEVMNSDYIRTARAKGLKENKVIYKHAFRNTLIPLVTTLAGLLPSLFSGALITEKVFDISGIGNVALKAMNAGDIPFIMGYNMFLALLSVIGVLLSDIMYAVVDPRVKLE